MICTLVLSLFSTTSKYEELKIVCFFFQQPSQLRAAMTSTIQPLTMIVLGNVWGAVLIISGLYRWWLLRGRLARTKAGMASECCAALFICCVIASMAVQCTMWSLEYGAQRAHPNIPDDKLLGLALNSQYAKVSFLCWLELLCLGCGS